MPELLSLVDDTAAVEPVGLVEAQDHLRVDLADEATILADLLVAAREHIEQETGRQVVEVTWDLLLDAFPRRGVIRLPRPPLRSVSDITYIDPDGALQTWSSDEYTVDAPAGILPARGRIYPKPTYRFPATLLAPGAVTIRFVTGYEASKVPEIIKRTILMVTADLYERREWQHDGRVLVANDTARRLIHRMRLPVYA